VSSKVSQEELDAVGEYANRHGITVSNLIRMLLVREVSAPRVLPTSVENEEPNGEKQEPHRKKTMLERLAESGRSSRLERERLLRNR
jgi:hypothetical protein